MNHEKYFELRQKLIASRFDRSNARLQINFCIKQDKKIRVTLCFPAEDWHLISNERQFFEDLVEKFLSSEEWYLKSSYKLTTVQKTYFDHNTITRFTMRRFID